PRARRRGCGSPSRLPGHDTREPGGVSSGFMAGVFPEPEEAVRLAVGPESITWRRAGDARAMFGAGAALLLQVAHPTVAAGVREHSDFKADPWGRLWRTL